MNHDVIVIGAGPAGALLAYRLADQGLKVLILERQILPRYKACGGGVTLKAIKSIPFDVSPILERRALGGILSFNCRPVHKVELTRPVAWLVMRDRFDQFLVEQAVASGAELGVGVHVRDIQQDEQGVQVRTRQGTYRALLLAGADGVNSQVAASSGLLRDRRTGVAIEAEVKVPPAALEAQGGFATFDFGAVPGGYAWIFPKREHLSAGVFQANTGNARNLKHSLAQFINCHPVLKDHQGLSQRGHRVPLGGKPEKLHNGRILLVGDAANLADPWLGEGIYYAIASAHEAAGVMLNALQGDCGDLSPYTRRINRNILPQFREARRIAGFVYRVPGFCSFGLKHSPYVFDSIFGLLRGECEFKQLTRRLFAGIPRIFYEMLRNQLTR